MRIKRIGFIISLVLILTSCEPLIRTEEEVRREKNAKEMADLEGWSKWEDVPQGYVVEEGENVQIRYRSSVLETTTSTQDSLEGWIPTKSSSTTEIIGPWSDWSNAEIIPSENEGKNGLERVEVETRNNNGVTEYRSRTVQTSRPS